jgi:hypothetical protein
LMGLIDDYDIRRQIQQHKQVMAANFSGSYSKGIFPPENAFSSRIIPPLVDEGLQWVLVDNAHFDRAAQGYPFSTSGNLYEPNKADQRNPNPNDWVQLNGLWAPTRNSARWGRQPHYVEYVNPNDGTKKKIIAVPADRYMGNEDGRGGFGALNYENVMSQLEGYNTDPTKPILIVLHHDGDNYGGGTDSYYGSNFQNFVNWLQANPTRFVCSTIQDYLQMFPPDPNDVIHIEDGSWSGADNGDPEFKKWNGDPSAGYSPDRNSWGVITAAKNIVATANQISPSHANMANAWKYLTNGEASDYWYWDGSQGGIWDSHPTRASNQAVSFALPVIAGGADVTPPTIYLPQREPYNPGGTEWGISQTNNFTVWTYAFDISGLQSVTLKYRLDLDGTNSNTSVDNDTYAGGSEVGSWTNVAMAGTSIASQTNPSPTYKAKEYSGAVNGLNNKLLDYYVEAVDSLGNIARSPIQHVWVGANTSGGGEGGTPTVSWLPANPTINDSITITVTNATQGAKLHWGINNVGSSWQSPNNVYWTTGSYLYNVTGPAVESPMVGPDTSGKLILKIGPFNNPLQSVQRIAFVVHYNDNSWNNNSGQDYNIQLSGGSTQLQFVMNGSIDSAAQMIANANGMSLYASWNGVDLYVGTQAAPGQGGDMFIFVSDSLRPLRNAQWAKAGQVAQWSAFLGNESTNNYSGWFNASGSGYSTGVANAAGASLEGTVNLQSLFGTVPSVVYLAVGKWQTNDGGSLITQSPSGNGNGNIESGEFQMYQLSLMKASVKCLLEGPFNLTTGLMEKSLNTSGVLASRFVGTTVPSEAVDSVTIEIRDSASVASATVRKFRPAWLLTDGTIRSFSDATKNYVEADVSSNDYYLVLHHRNHLSVRSAVKYSLSSSSTAAYDFTSGQSQAFGTEPMKEVSTGVFALYAGDANASTLISTADANDIFNLLSLVGYSNSDVNLSGIVSAADANMVLGNLNRSAQRPMLDPLPNLLDEK